MKLSEFFYFTKSDRLVLLTMFVVAAVAMLLFWLAGSGNDYTELTAADSLAIEQQQSASRVRYARGGRPRPGGYAVPARPAERFVFDPNTADSNQLLRLGLRPWQVRNIYKYRAAGGIYRKPEDFARLYGLTRKQFRELQPYIRISDDYLAASTIYNFEPAAYRDTVRSPVKIKPLERVSLNTADTAMLKHVPGIGSFFARSIVDYRKRLGGFYSIAQLTEIENFPESSLSYFVIPDGEQLHKLNLNTLSLNELRRHPYISFYQARAIVDYRRLHGPLKSLRDLSLHRDFGPEAIARLEPYVEF